MRVALRPALVLVSVLILSSCAATANQAAPTPTMVEPHIDPKAQAAVDAALRDAAAKVGGNPADLRVEQVLPQEWSDSSLGCPQPGAMYAQVITPGFRIVIAAGARQLEYHADERGRVVLCSQP